MASFEEGRGGGGGWRRGKGHANKMEEKRTHVKNLATYEV